MLKKEISNEVCEYYREDNWKLKVSMIKKTEVVSKENTEEKESMGYSRKGVEGKHQCLRK